MKKMYIAGKVTGLPLEDVQKNFKQGEQFAKSMGYHPVVPVYHIPDDEPWDKAMRTNLKLMLDCDAVLLLNNYSTSRGALIEVMVAESINGWRYGLVKADHYQPIEELNLKQPLLTIPFVSVSFLSVSSAKQNENGLLNTQQHKMG